MSARAGGGTRAQATPAPPRLDPMAERLTVAVRLPTHVADPTGAVLLCAPQAIRVTVHQFDGTRVCELAPGSAPRLLEPADVDFTRPQDVGGRAHYPVQVRRAR